MLARTSFRINKSIHSPVKTKRLHSEGNKNISQHPTIDFDPEITSPTLRGWSPQSTMHFRKTVIKLKQQKSTKRTIIKLGKKSNITEIAEDVLPQPSPLDLKSVSLKEQSEFTLIPVPIEQDFSHNFSQQRKQSLVYFPRKLQSRKYSQNNSPTADTSQIMDLDVGLYNDAQKIIQQLHIQVSIGNTFPTIRRYLEIISKGNLNDFHHIIKHETKAKVIQTFIRYQRSMILLIAMNDALQKLSVHYNLIYSLIKCCLDSRVLILSLLKKEMQKQQNKQMDTPSYFNSQQVLKSSNMQIRNFEIIKTNNDIILNLLQKLTIQKNYFTDSLRRTLKDQSLQIYKFFYNLLESFSFFLHSNDLEDKVPFLAIAPNPYLPPSHKYTLVIDLLQVMFDQQSSCFRPQSQSFIEQMSKYYQLISYSAKMPKQMQALIRFVDRKNNIKHRLYKQHFFKQKQKFTKDLSRIGRPLTEILLVDTQQCEQNPFNTFIVKKWTGNPQDKSLQQAIYFLSSLPIKNANIQQAIKKHKEQQIKKKQKPRRYSFWNNNNNNNNNN